MRFSRNARARMVAVLLLVAMLVTFVQPIQAQAASGTKIHFLSLDSTTLSVLVESNGQFGMVDSGEDTDYPDGTDPRYPDRPHTTKGIGHEQEVISYLKSVGVTKDNFVFYIGTHPHSDHIGSADEVIREFSPERVYLQEYKDSYVSDASRLWDNLYVYDQMIAAAKEVGAQLIQKIDASNATFTLGSAQINILNYGDDYKTNPEPDANYFSLGVLVKDNGKSAFISGDINNFDGDETALISKLGKVDVFTLGHHGCYGSNSYKYVTGMDPDLMIVPGDYRCITNSALPGDKSVFDTVIEMGQKGVPLYATSWFSGKQGAIVVNLDSALSTNIPANFKITVAATGVYPQHTIVYENGLPVSVAVTGTWIEDGDRWWYRHGDGTYTTSDWEQINGNWFYFDAEGWMVTGWLKLGNTWYYLEPTKGPNEGIRRTGWLEYQGAWYYLQPGTGKMLTGWQTIDGKTYYFNADGAKIVNTTVDGKYLDSNGVYVPARQAEWITEGGRKWYRHADGSYTVNDWEEIGGKWYFFDSEGWMKTGWITWKNEKYYLNPSNGVMVTGWQTIDNKTYYFYDYGGMAVNTTIDGKRLGSDGVYTPITAGWVTEGNRKWYRHADGSYTVNDWEEIGGKWYFFDSEGWMKTGWITWKNEKYYLNPSNGVMVTGWQTIDNKTYYFHSYGGMAVNTTIDGKRLGSDGVYTPITAGWVTEGGRKWYRHADGSYTVNDWEQIGGKWYFFDSEGWMKTGWITWKNAKYYLNPSNGAMVTGWNTISGKTYYFNGDGAMMTGWIQLSGKWYYQDASGARVTGWLDLNGTWYYLYPSNGVMAANTWVDGYYVNADGVWVP